MVEHKNGSCFTLGVITYMPHIIVTPGPNSVVTGSLLEILSIVSQHLGICVRYQESADKAGGVRLPNGSWTGVMAMLTTGEADLSSVLVVDEERYKAFDVGEFLYMDEHSAGYRRPVVQSDISGFIRPFTVWVWLMILMTLLGVTASTCVLRHGNERRFRQVRFRGSPGPEKGRDVRVPGLATFTGESVIWTVSALLAQSVPLKAPGGVVRLLMGLWMILSLTLMTVYRSNLKAMLIMPRVTIPFDSLQDLVTTDLPVWVATQSVLHNFAMQAEPNTDLGRLNSMFNSVHGHSNVTWGVNGFVTGKHVLAAPRTALLEIIHSAFSKMGMCSTYLMSESFLRTTIGLIYPKGSTLRPKIDPLIVRLREGGILDYIYHQAVINSSKCLKPLSSIPDTSRALDLGDFYGVFVYGGGMMLGCVAFLLELLLAPFRNEVRQETSSRFPSSSSPRRTLQ
ncbi:glutamate receptor ionotropic, delta-2-like isoform X2 [Homarus americanus]|uniref:glutamate receptor ionotropic, delta-2-like isoform X2 n=1 Tax=Homarus americanus TaxID=6706 RepID=UPI001C496F9A|nr:glutamate receptor ionotropic, delta-2-like isoform X2 [Homarus americanus]